jgi:hypothetical protein
MRIGRLWRAAGLGERAGAIFERALRYAPDEPDALAGLGAAMVAEGNAARGTALLARAVELADAHRKPAAGISLDLACALAECLDDLPGAIARASTIAPDAAEAPVARGLEGRWRARLGDVSGATLAFARLREFAASLPPSEDERTRRIAALLVEAAEMQEVARNDPISAQRCLGEALRLRPHDRALRARYREVCATVARDAGSTNFDAFEAASATHATPMLASHAPSLDLGLPSESPGADEDDARAHRVEELKQRIVADASDENAATELASLLEALGRGHELLALLSARLEDAAPERRAELVTRTRAVLQHLADESEKAGRIDEAAMYRAAAAALSP